VRGARLKRGGGVTKDSLASPEVHADTALLRGDVGPLGAHGLPALLHDVRGGCEAAEGGVGALHVVAAAIGRQGAGLGQQGGGMDQGLGRGAVHVHCVLCSRCFMRGVLCTEEAREGCVWWGGGGPFGRRFWHRVCIYREDVQVRKLTSEPLRCRFWRARGGVRG